MPDPNSLPSTGPTHVSQSECKAAQDCGLAWHALWNLGVRMSSTDGPSQRVGSLGHACLAEHVVATHVGEHPDMQAAMEREADKRRYLTIDNDGTPFCSDELLAQMDLAQHAAESLIASPDFNVTRPILDPTGHPMVEAKLVAEWNRLRVNAGLDLPQAMLDVFTRGNRRRGMEGTLDVLHEGPPGLRRVLYLDDYKFRTR